MTVLRQYPEYLNQDNIADIEDLFDITKNTEGYRANKVKDLRKEHDLIMCKIDRVTRQKEAYVRASSVLPSSEKIENIMPVIKNDDFDTGSSELSSVLESNNKLLIRRYTDPILNFIRDNLRENMPEIDIKLRDYDYQLLKLSWMEKRITYLMTVILKKETTSQQATA